MAAISTIVAVAALTISAASYVSGEHSRKEAQEASAQAAGEQRKAGSEQAALNTQRAALERRQQIREERVRRAKMLQASENSGTAGSSGELGATAGLANQLGVNIAFNQGQLAGQGRANAFGQAGADYMTEANIALSDASSASNLFNLSTNIFQSSGGFSNFKTKTGK